MSRRNDSGFGTVELIGGIVLLILIGNVGYYVYHGRHVAVSSNLSATSTHATTRKTQPALNPVADQTTLTGVVTMGPTSPVCHNGTPCGSVVTNHIVTAKDVSGTVVATSTTNANGVYTLVLKPGQYTLSLTPEVGPGMSAPSQVTVGQGVNKFNLTFDTGIR